MVAALAAPFTIPAGGEPALKVVPVTVALLLAGTAWNLTRRPSHREPALVASRVALRVGAVVFAGSICICGFLLRSPGPWLWLLLVVPLALVAFVTAGFWHLAALCRIMGACHARVVCLGMAWGIAFVSLALIPGFFLAQGSMMLVPLGSLALALLVGAPAVALVELSVVRGRLHEASADAWAWVEDRAPGLASWHGMGRMVRVSLAAFVVITTLCASYAATRYRSCAGRLVEVDRTPRRAFTPPAAATVSSTLAALSLVAGVLLVAMYRFRRRANLLRGAPGWIEGTLLPSGMIDLHRGSDQGERPADAGEPLAADRLQLVGTGKPGPVMIPPIEIERAHPYRGFPRIPSGVVVFGDRDDAAAEAWVAAHRANVVATFILGLLVVAVLVAAWGFTSV